MKKISMLLLCGAALWQVSCKSTENAYKMAYEKAIAEDVAAPAPAPEVKEPSAPVTAEQVEAVQVREESVTLVSGEVVRSYGVVCGSFSLKSNAEALRTRLANDGYPAVVVVNEAGKTFRVIAESFDTKSAAVQKRDEIKRRYPDNRDFQAAWILYKK